MILKIIEIYRFCLSPGYEGEIPDGYFVVKCPTYRNWIMVRGFVEDTGTGDEALDYYRKKFRIYPIRLYGPLEAYFDEEWKPDDIVKVN